MNSKEELLLDCDEIVFLFESIDTLKTCDLIANHMKNKMFISNDKLYVLKENVIYEHVVNGETTNIHDKIGTYQTINIRIMNKFREIS